jgi:hypothetical protein
VALTRWLIKRDITIAISELDQKRQATAGRGESSSTHAETIKVVVQVEAGRVTRAFVEEHRAGMEAYEALALRIARTRRYAATANGRDTVTVRINAPD